MEYFKGTQFHSQNRFNSSGSFQKCPKSKVWTENNKIVRILHQLIYFKVKIVNT